MMPSIRARTVLAPFALGAAVTLALLLATYAIAAADTGPPSLASESGIAAWWQSGALAGPIVAVVAVILVGLERLSVTRWPGLGWLRRGSMRAYLSITIGAVVGLLPQAADGSLSMGGVSVALLGGLVAFRPGGGEPRPVTERAGEIEA